ncbi:MAG: hypothetical protein AAF501_04150 [Pseudomonadota bacterium]
MPIIVIAGAIISLAGIGMLVLCALRARGLRNADPADPEAKEMLQKLIALNMVGVFSGFLGLGIVAVGLFLK